MSIWKKLISEWTHQWSVIGDQLFKTVPFELFNGNHHGLKGPIKSSRIRILGLPYPFMEGCLEEIRDHFLEKITHTIGKDPARYTL